MLTSGLKKWSKVLGTKLTWNDYLVISLIVLAVFVFLELIFTGHAVAADPVSPDAGKGAATGLEKAWQTLFKGDGSPSFFGTLANTLKGIGIIAIVMQTAKVIFKFASSDGDPSAREFVRSQLVERLIPSAIVIMMLANNGAGGANLILNARSFIFSWDKVAYTAMKDVADNLAQQQIIGEERKVLENVRTAFNTCISIPPKIGGENNPVFTGCIGDFQTKVLEASVSGKIKNESVRAQLGKLHQDLAKASQGNYDDSFGRILINSGAVVSTLATSSIKNATDELVNGFVSSIGIAYNFCVELALMLMGVSLPLVLLLSLYKIDVFLKWLPQLLNLFVAKISYTIVGGLVQYIKADAGSDLGEWGLAILIGLGAPFVSIFTAMALSGAMGSVFEREAVRAGAGAARAAAGGVGAAGKMLGGAVGSLAGAGGAAAAKALDIIAKRV